MHILWHGQSCFQIITTPQKGEQVSVCVDPFSKDIGLRSPSFAANLVLVTHDHYDHNNKQALSGQPFIIDGPGEYEIKDVFIQGIQSWHDAVEGKERGKNTIYTIDTEDMRLCHLGDLGQKELSDRQLEQMGDVDILMIPVGGVYTINGQEAAKIISQVEPRVVIPMHYAIPKLKVKLDGVDKFLKAMGVRVAEPQGKLLVKKKDLGEEETKVILLKP